MNQLTLWELDEWTPALRAEAIRIMEEWVLAHGGTL